ncbi:hypothetical protein [Fodinicola feengrottensis]
MTTKRSRAFAGVLAGVSVFAGIASIPAAAQAATAPYDISPQRVAGSYAADGLHVFVRGTTGYLYQKVIAKNGQQGSWTVFDTTQVASSPASTVDSEGRVYLAVRATNGNVLYQWREPNGSWTGWKNIGGTTYGAPALQAIPAQNGQYPEVLIAAQNSAGQPQARAFTPGTLSPPIAHWASWVGLDDQVLQAAPMLGAAQGCQDTPRDGAPDSAQPNAVVLLGRGSNGNGMQREVCGDAPSPAPATWFLNSEGTSSGIASDSHGGVWFRGTDGALWDGTRVGVPAAGRRVACTPTVAGYQVPKNGGTPTDPRSVLVRDDQGTSWLYVPVEEDGTGGTWTNLGGIAT